MNKTIIWLLVAIALGAYVWFYEIEGEEQRQAEKELEEKLIAIEKDSIQTLIINDFETTYRFEKINDKWRITSPVNTDADESTVNGYLTSLSSAKRSRTFTAEVEEKATYGLSNPFIRVKVINEEGKADSVQFGDKTGIGEDMYFSKNLADTVIGITPISLKNNSQKPLLTWRDKRAIQFDKNSVYSFDFQSAKNKFSFEKNGTDWYITNPLNTKADNVNVNAILNKLDFGRVKSVEAETAQGLSKYGLTNPGYKIELFDAGKVKLGSVAFSSLEDNKSFVKDEARPHIFSVDSNFVKVFNKSLDDLRDKDLIGFNESTVNRINLLFDNQIMTFTKDTSDTWNISSGEALKSASIDDLIKDVNNLKVEKFVSEKPTYLSPFGLTPPKGSLELFSDSSKDVDLEFGKEQNDNRYVRNVTTGQVVMVKEDKLSKILINLDDVIDESATADEQ